eukprot:CAMPEP_0167755088 /NCGR_PEP_ID=MMETSP0110_2-20121227/8628_1 /TAXON_ID=629695 /ORGANISM="Gymnochlora sp., Strain CCMP2014" /LENGTH=161 /DNA_ID=CAMNT_0007641033 /DNA_START=122 /DNA_END=608 /DNA_ORIENTATION=+
MATMGACVKQMATNTLFTSEKGIDGKHKADQVAGIQNSADLKTSVDVPVEKQADVSNTVSGEDEKLPVKGNVRAPELMLIAFTCTVCDTRSARTFSKKSYEEGVVIITCPECKSNHLIADRLGWFDDEGVDIQSIMREKGEDVVYIKDADGGGRFELSNND